MFRSIFLSATALALCAAAPPPEPVPSWRTGDVVTVRNDDAVACSRPETLTSFYGGDLHDRGAQDWQPEQPEALNCMRSPRGKVWRFVVSVDHGDIVELHFNSAQAATVWMRTRDVEFAGSANDYPGWWDGSQGAQ